MNDPRISTSRVSLVRQRLQRVNFCCEL